MSLSCCDAALLASPASFERHRARALAAGPTDAAVNDALLSLWADVSELASGMGCVDSKRYDELNALRADALRTGNWTAYGQAWRTAIDEVLLPRAIENARRQQVRSWDDGAQAINSYVDHAFDRVFGAAA